MDISLYINPSRFGVFWVFFFPFLSQSIFFVQASEHCQSFCKSQAPCPRCKWMKIPDLLSPPAQAAQTKFHRLVVQTTGIYSLTGLEAQVKIRVSPGLVFPAASLLSLQTATFFLVVSCHISGVSSFSYKDTGPIGLGPHPVALSSRLLLPRSFLEKQLHWLDQMSPPGTTLSSSLSICRFVFSIIQAIILKTANRKERSGEGEFQTVTQHYGWEQGRTSQAEQTQKEGLDQRSQVCRIKSSGLGGIWKTLEPDVLFHLPHSYPGVACFVRSAAVKQMYHTQSSPIHQASSIRKHFPIPGQSLSGASITESWLYPLDLCRTNPFLTL